MTLKNFPMNTGDDGTPVAATATSQSVEVAAAGNSRRLISEDVLIDNPGPNDVFVKAGDASTVATVNSLRVPAGSLQPYRKGQSTHVAVVCKAGQTQTVVLHVGDGQ